MDRKFAGLLGRVVGYYRHTLVNAPAMRERLGRWGVTDAAALERFTVGVANGTICNIMPRDDDVRESLKTLGILKADGSERHTGSISIPVFDDQGNVVQIAFYAEDKSLTWLFDETEAWWNGACLKHSRIVALVRDILAGLVRMQNDPTVAVIAPAGLGVPLGQGAKEWLALYSPHVTIEASDAEWARAIAGEIGKLGGSVDGVSEESALRPERIIHQDANGFTIQFPRRLRFVLQGISQDSGRHLRASVKVFRSSNDSSRSPIHLDTFDLYHARSRQCFARTGACLLGVDPLLMEEHLQSIVTLAEGFLAKRQESPTAVVLTASEREEAMAFLKDPDLLNRVLADLAHLGYVGEESNKRIAYLAAVSRKLDDPLSALVISRSGAGKSTLADMIAMLVPPEDCLRFTRLTPQSLYYQKSQALAHKLIVVEETSGIDEAAYALRVLQSARKLSLATTSGYKEAETRQVAGPASVFVTTTRTAVDEETAGRFLTLSADESEEQTKRILDVQRQDEMRPSSDHDRILRLHHNAQRLLLSRPVVNPYASQLTFPHHRLSARRDHKKYLALIRSVAFLHQYQRKIENDVVVVDIRDIAIANRLADDALGHFVDDLTPPSKMLLISIHRWVKEHSEVRFSQRELRDHTGWKKSQLAEHVRELVEAEYLIKRMEQGSGRRVRYMLDWDGQGMDGERFYRGLTDTTRLDASGSSGERPCQFRLTSTGDKKTQGDRRKRVAKEIGGSVRETGERKA